MVRAESRSVVAEMPDGVAVTVKGAPEQVAAQSTFMKVIEVVESKCSLRAEMCTCVDDNFGATLNLLRIVNFTILSI